MAAEAAKYTYSLTGLTSTANARLSLDYNIIPTSLGTAMGNFSYSGHVDYSNAFPFVSGGEVDVSLNDSFYAAAGQRLTVTFTAGGFTGVVDGVNLNGPLVVPAISRATNSGQSVR
jgi:hypothetical protein